MGPSGSLPRTANTPPLQIAPLRYLLPAWAKIMRGGANDQGWCLLLGAHAHCLTQHAFLGQPAAGETVMVNLFSVCGCLLSLFLWEVVRLCFAWGKPNHGPSCGADLLLVCAPCNVGFSNKSIGRKVMLLMYSALQ